MENKSGRVEELGGRSIEDDLKDLHLSSVNHTRINPQTRNVTKMDTLEDGRILPLRMPINYTCDHDDAGTVLMGKIESGNIRQGENLMIMPNKAQVQVLDIFLGDDQVNQACPGDKIHVRVSGIKEDDIMPGFVLCEIAKPVPAVSEFVARLQILELPDNALVCAGFRAMLRVHTVAEEECEIVELVAQIEPVTKKPMRKKPVFVKKGAVVVCRIQVKNLICVEKFSDSPQLGRFMLRSDKLAAVGRVTSLTNVASE